jgi:hypothetical protein
MKQSNNSLQRAVCNGPPRARNELRACWGGWASCSAAERDR